MMGWSMSDGRVGVGSLPGENGSAIDDEIACANQAATERYEHREDEETFVERSSGRMTALTLLGRTGNAQPSLPVIWQATGQG
jgi:hypothetical protein